MSGLSKLIVWVLLALPGLGWALPLAAIASCRDVLPALSAEWHAAGFQVPSKPSQAVVIGRDGRRATGAEVTDMRKQLRAAFTACERGDEVAALQAATRLRAALLSTQPSGAADR
jgi:hypothetical protein